MMLRWSVPAQLCFMPASATRVTYGEAGLRFCSSSQQHDISFEFFAEHSSQQSHGLQQTHMLDRAKTVKVLSIIEYEFFIEGRPYELGRTLKLRRFRRIRVFRFHAARRRELH